MTERICRVKEKGKLMACMTAPTNETVNSKVEKSLTGRGETRN